MLYERRKDFVNFGDLGGLPLYLYLIAARNDFAAWESGGQLFYILILETQEI
jgi:hypothetical protein